MSLVDTDCCDDVEGAGDGPQAAPNALDAAVAALSPDDPYAALWAALAAELVATREQLAAQVEFAYQVAQLVEQAAPVMDALAQGGVGGIFKLLRG